MSGFCDGGVCIYIDECHLSALFFHPQMLYAQMAEAGFYWCGSVKEEDTAACFLCGKVLDGWESTDDPWSEHKKHAPQCAFVKLGRPQRQLTVNEHAIFIRQQFDAGRSNSIAAKS